MWLLKAQEQVETPLTFRILPGNIKTMGRSSGAEFIVDAALVSRLHCRLTAGAGALEVADLDSTNGIFVNGERVTQATLKAGDRLGVGRVEFIISRERAQSPETLEGDSPDLITPGLPSPGGGLTGL